MQQKVLTLPLGKDHAIKVHFLTAIYFSSKSALSTSFPYARPSVTEVKGFLGKSGLNTRNFYQLSYKVYF